MRVRLVRQAGQPGTKAYVDEYGDRLVCVRYRYDEAKQRRYKTVELIVDEQPWLPPYRPETMMAIRIGPKEYAIQEQLRRVGARWNKPLNQWELSYAHVRSLNLLQRIIGPLPETKERT